MCKIVKINGEWDFKFHFQKLDRKDPSSRSICQFQELGSFNITQMYDRTPLNYTSIYQTVIKTAECNSCYQWKLPLFLSVIIPSDVQKASQCLLQFTLKSFLCSRTTYQIKVSFNYWFKKYFSLLNFMKMKFSCACYGFCFKISFSGY